MYNKDINIWRCVQMNAKYGRLTVVKTIANKGEPKKCLCKCDCGNVKVVSMSNLISGKTKSCGCLRREVARERRLLHNKYYIQDGVAHVSATNTGNIFLVDSEDWERIKNISWYEGANGYIQHKENNKSVMLIHRVIENAKDGLVVDHINHNKLDNRKENLRVCTYSENARNRTVKPCGICKIKRGDRHYYVVQLVGQSKNSYRGCYKNYSDAKAKADEIIKNEYL